LCRVNIDAISPGARQKGIYTSISSHFGKEERKERDGFVHTAIQDRTEVDSENVAPEEVFHMKRLLLLSAVLLTSLALAAPGQARLAIGDPAPDFSLPDVNSDYHSLSDYEGQVVLINFWASW
jgi:hypothetical protein